MVNIVVVSHSRKLAEGVIELASQMTQGKVEFALAAGLDDQDNPIGTDPVAIMEAIEMLSHSESILIVVDMGSAILSTDVALELVDPDIVEKIHVCAAPIVEGTVSAAVAAASGLSIEQVVAEAHSAIAAKYKQLNQEQFLTLSGDQEKNEAELGQEFEEITIQIKNPNGIHARPSAVIAKAMNQFDADILLCKGEESVSAKSVNNIALLSIKCGEEVQFKANGPDALTAIEEFVRLSADNFGDGVEDAVASSESRKTNEKIAGRAYVYNAAFPALNDKEALASDVQIGMLQTAINGAKTELQELVDYAGSRLSDKESAIFEAHQMMLEDTELFDMAVELIHSDDMHVDKAWLEVVDQMAAEYKAIDDTYLSDRYVDVYDVGLRVLNNLSGFEVESVDVDSSSVLFANYLLPSQVIKLNPKQVRGIGFDSLGVKSHPALIAKALNIPVFANKQNLEGIHGTDVVVDTGTG